MSATQNSTLPTREEARLGSAGVDRPVTVERSLCSVQDKPMAATTLPTSSSATDAYQIEQPNRRIPSLMPQGEFLSQDTFALLEKWDGVVIESDNETFTARLYNSNESSRVIQARFSKSELSPQERGQVEEGATFVWTIGYRNIGSTRHRDSALYFRRLPVWETSELEAAKRRARELGNTIGWR